MGVLFCRGFLCRRVDSCEGGHDMNRTYGLCFLAVFEIHISHFDQFMFSKSWHRGHIFFVPRYCKTQSACVLGLSLVYLKPLRFVFHGVLVKSVAGLGFIAGIFGWLTCWILFKSQMLRFVKSCVWFCVSRSSLIKNLVLVEQESTEQGRSTNRHGAPSWNTTRCIYFFLPKIFQSPSRVISNHFQRALYHVPSWYFILVSHMALLHTWSQITKLFLKCRVQTGVEVPQSHTSPDTALAVWARRKWSVMFHVWDFADETCYTITFVCFYVFLSSHSAKIPNYWNCRLKTEMGMVNLPSNCIFDWEYAARTSVDTPYAGCRFLFRFACQGSDGRGVSRTGALIGDTFGMCGWCRVNWLSTLEVCTVFMLDFFV